MAKHLVKCFFCGQTFDANVEPYIMVNSRRYAHENCFNKNQEEKTQEEKDKESLEAYIKQLFNINSINTKIKKQIKKYIEEDNFTYSGIRRSLVYFYEIKQNSIEKANGGIGIVEYVYSEAFNYYYNLWLAQQKNENKNINDYFKPKEEILITIPPPQRKVRKRKLFSFLDKENEK